uniref:Uncharacterized protein n=1 Tax=Arundo donax TaxID=35708 RepID=A0A0A9ARW9_ARUDO
MNNEAYKLSSRYTKGTFGWIHLQAIPPGSLQHLSQIGYVPINTFGLYHHIININFNQSANQIMKYVIHGPLIGSTSIFETKRHYYPLVEANCSRTPKRSLRNIFFGHKYLIITCIAIHKTDNLISCCCINQKIFYRHRVIIFGSSFIQRSEINTHSEFPIFLDYRNYIRNPLRISAWPNKFGIIKSCNFFFNGLI